MPKDFDLEKSWTLFAVTIPIVAVFQVILFVIPVIIYFLYFDTTSSFSALFSLMLMAPFLPVFPISYFFGSWIGEFNFIILIFSLIFSNLVYSLLTVYTVKFIRALRRTK